MKTKLRKLLDQIDNYLSTEEEDDSRALWAILSALRGPDDYDDVRYKDATTSVLRAAAFPKTALVSSSVGGRVCASMVNDDAYRATFRGRLALRSHFITHAMGAFRALELRWGTDNSKKEKQ